MLKKNIPSYETVWREYEKGLVFNTRLGLNETVRTNENFFIGKQWEGIEANGLPTPVFNFLKRVVLFTVAGITSSSIKMHASSMAGSSGRTNTGMIADIVNAEFDKLFETNKLPALIRELMRNTAVDGDGCTYTYWDPDIETGQLIKGAIVTEIIENTRVFFGNANDRRVQKQPYIIISSREMEDTVKDRAMENGCPDWEAIRTDNDEREMNHRNQTDDKVTVLLRLWRNKDTGTIWGYECTQNAEVRPAWDTGLTLYPVTWLNWDYVQDNYHGMAMITGLIPNQIFINKLYAMSMISLMTTAYPKIVYDKTRIAKWDNRVGAAIPVQGGDVSGVAKIIDPAQISPQIAQFIQMAVEDTKSNLGATNVALGDARPENSSAIIALQKASAVPNEITRQNLYQNLEDLGRIYIDFMSEYYGIRIIGQADTSKTADVSGVSDGLKKERVHDKKADFGKPFDFSELKDAHISLKLDVGASSYWSEIASMQTLDNLMMRGKLDLIDYLERVPEGYIIKKQELLDKLKSSQDKPSSDQAAGAAGAAPTGQVMQAGLRQKAAANPAAIQGMQQNAAQLQQIAGMLKPNSAGLGSGAANIPGRSVPMTGGLPSFEQKPVK